MQLRISFHNPLKTWRHRNRMVPASPSLLGLPAELRLMIYEYVLVQGVIPITRHYKPPGLLGTSRRIRNEAQEIYYSWDNNHFRFNIRDCDASLVLKYQHNIWRHSPLVRQSRVRFNFIDADWDNLMHWCQGLREYKALPYRKMLVPSRFDYWPPQIAVPTVVVSALEITIASGKKKQKWRRCEKTLDSLREVANLVDRGWRN